MLVGYKLRARPPKYHHHNNKVHLYLVNNKFSSASPYLSWEQRDKYLFLRFPKIHNRVWFNYVSFRATNIEFFFQKKYWSKFLKQNRFLSADEFRHPTARKLYSMIYWETGHQ